MMIHERLRKFREKLQQGVVVGPFSKTEDPAMIECMGYAGFDFCIIDMEHGPHSVAGVQSLVRAAEVSGMLPIIRVPEGDLTRIGAVLDVGAAGVQVPQVVTPEFATAAIAAAKYSPAGGRGVCRYVRNAGYSSMQPQQYFSSANEALTILQLEGKEALDNLEDILAVDGIDIIFIGPYDLSQSLGVVGQTQHQQVIATMERIVSKCHQHGVVVGTFVESIEQADFWRERGLKYIAYSVDVGIFLSACQEIYSGVVNA
jgi:4-hydroxy-2-oxoheptanedioate aldolase